jgi:hypothetical protein
MWRLPSQTTKAFRRRGNRSFFSSSAIATVIRPLNDKLVSTPTSPFFNSIVGKINSNNNIINRNFARRPKNHLDDPGEELLEESESTTLRTNEGSIAAWDMEFFGDEQLTTLASSASYNDDDDDDDDEAERAAMRNEEYRKRQEEIQRELESRTGRPWKDPWAISEEQWMSNTRRDDLPDWSPKLVSRISQERVRVHPGE